MFDGLEYCTSLELDIELNQEEIDEANRRLAELREKEKKKE